MPCILKATTTEKRDVCCVIGEVRDINSSATCILQTTVHGATQPNFHLLLVQDIEAERWQFQSQDYWSVRKDGQTENCVATAGCVAACLQGGPQNQNSDVVLCLIVCKMHVAQLFVCLLLFFYLSRRNR
jgi:hypothetical protein